MTENNQPIISQLQAVHKTFTLPGGRELPVLKDVDLEIREGEIVTLLGPSGCGKSTLMRILAGLLKPTSGSVKYRGRQIRAVNPAVSVVFQNFALFPWLDVAENIEQSLYSLSLSAPRRKARVKQVIDLIGLEGFEELYPRELSSGMKQRLCIARALVVEPEILCLDEPFSQADALTAESLRGEMIKLWLDQDRNPKSIFMASHDIKEVVSLATRIVIFGSPPSSILAVVPNNLPYPRDYRDPTFIALEEQIYDLLTRGIMPDAEPAPVAPPGPGAPEPPVEALPPAEISQIIGLLEMLDDRGGEVNIFAFTNELRLEFGQAIAVAKAAEMLDLVDTPRQRVILTTLGRQFVSAEINDRKAIWGRQLRNIKLFQIFGNLVELVGQDGVPSEEVLDELSSLLPVENAETILEIMVNWAQYGELFILDSDEDKLIPYEYESTAEQ